MRLVPANNNQMMVRLDGAREVAGIDSATPARPAADVTLPAGTGQQNLNAGRPGGLMPARLTATADTHHAGPVSGGGQTQV
jgi:hypothetical protein